MLDLAFLSPSATFSFGWSASGFAFAAFVLTLAALPLGDVAFVFVCAAMVFALAALSKECSLSRVLSFRSFFCTYFLFTFFFVVLPVPCRVGKFTHY